MTVTVTANCRESRVNWQEVFFRPQILLKVGGIKVCIRNLHGSDVGLAIVAKRVESSAQLLGITFDTLVTPLSCTPEIILLEDRL